MSEVKPTDEANYPKMWEHRWESGNTHWDQSKVHGALLHFLNSDESDKAGVARKGRAFVPGCGQGYDVDVFARRGLDSIGLDVAPTGVAAANKWLASQTGRPDVEAKVVEGDFFTYDAGEGFDVIYDYTFLCALPPTLRPKWGETMTKLSRAAPTTRLITLMYPLQGNPPPFGPPFSLDESDYDNALGKDWEIVYQVEVADEFKRKNAPPGNEKLTVWKRKL